jgi:molybdopterin-containing oxidoreductase family membrane subunit
MSVETGREHYGVSQVPPEIIGPGQTFETVTDRISQVVLTRKTPLGWFIGLGISLMLLLVFVMSLGMLLAYGTGIWGLNIPVGWAFDIVNFVWWVGIAHAGTLISAILLLLRQKWRTSINRFAEAMTLFAVSCAGLYPLMHLGRPWLAYWLLPYPNTIASVGHTCWHAVTISPSRIGRPSASAWPRTYSMRCTQYVHFSITPRERTVTSGLRCSLRLSSL